MSDLPRSRATAVQALIDLWLAKADKDWHQGHDDVDDGVWSYQHEANGRAKARREDAAELAALLPREGPPQDERRYCPRCSWEGPASQFPVPQYAATLREGQPQEPDWIGKCPKCNRTVLNHGDLCSQCAGLREGPPQGWQSIATAPIDATTLIGYQVKLPERWVRVGLGANLAGEWAWHQDVEWGPATHWMPLLHPGLKEGQEPDWIGKCPKCNRTVLNHGDLCSQCAGLREGQESPAITVEHQKWAFCPKCGGKGTNDASCGGNDVCWHCGVCGFIDCDRELIEPGLRGGPPAPQEEHNRVKFSQTDMDAQTKPLHIEIERLRGEIADAREACPSIRMQDNFDAPLLKLVNLEVSRGFNRDAEIYKLRALLPHSGPSAPPGHVGDPPQEGVPDHCENCRAELPVTTVHLCHACLPSAPSEHAGEAPATEPAHVECTASPSGKHQSFAGRRGWCEWCSQEFTPDASVCRDGHLIARASGRCIDCGINCSELAASQAGSAPREVSTVTRLEVIDETGRKYTRWGCAIELSYQDQGRTLKVFIEPNPSAPTRPKSGWLNPVLRAAHGAVPPQEQK